MPEPTPSDDPAALRRLHLRPKKYLEEWLDFPAHVHQTAFRMEDPPRDRPRSRQEFAQWLRTLDIPDENSALSEKFGYGVRLEENGDRLVVVWEAHTEYFKYLYWHIPDDKTKLLEFGPLALPRIPPPPTAHGGVITSLDIILSHEPDFAPGLIRELLPGPRIYGSRVFGDIAIATSFTPDDRARERYLIFAPQPQILLDHLNQVIDAVVTIENYYHLLLLPMPEFSRAVDRIHQLEQIHLRQRAALTNQLGGSDSKALQDWVNRLTQDFLEVSRFAQAMRFGLSASVPYHAILQATVLALQERPFPPFHPLSDYVLGGTSGVADGYQQLIKRIEAIEADFQSIISVIRTRVNLIQQDQSLVLGDQNLRILSSVDETTKSQVILQHTVEGLSVIVIAYYLSGLASYVFKALHGLGWIHKPDLATGIFVPISLGLSFILILLGRRVVRKRKAGTEGR